MTRMLALATQTIQALGATGNWFETGVFGDISAGVGRDFNASPASMRKPMRSSARHGVTFVVRKVSLPTRVEVEGGLDDWEEGFAEAGDTNFLAQLAKPLLERPPIQDVDEDNCKISAAPADV